MRYVLYCWPGIQDAASSSASRSRSRLAFNNDGIFRRYPELGG